MNIPGYRTGVPSKYYPDTEFRILSTVYFFLYYFIIIYINFLNKIRILRIINKKYFDVKKINTDVLIE